MTEERWPTTTARLWGAAAAVGPLARARDEKAMGYGGVCGSLRSESDAALQGWDKSGWDLEVAASLGARRRACVCVNTERMSPARDELHARDSLQCEQSRLAFSKQALTASNAECEMQRSERASGFEGERAELQIAAKKGCVQRRSAIKLATSRCKHPQRPQGNSEALQGTCCVVRDSIGRVSPVGQRRPPPTRRRARSTARRRPCLLCCPTQPHNFPAALSPSRPSESDEISPAS